MSFRIQDFRNQLIFQGARQNQFDISLTFPTVANPVGNANQEITFMAKAASQPPEEIGVIDVGYFGRKVKVPGDRTFPPWTITVYNDDTHNLRDSFERWSGILNQHYENIRTPAAQLERDFQTDPIVRQYAKIGGDPIKQYKLVGAWPSEVSPIELDWDTNDQIETFTVTLQYQWWESISATNGPTTDVADIPTSG